MIKSTKRNIRVQYYSKCWIHVCLKIHFEIHFNTNSNSEIILITELNWSGYGLHNSNLEDRVSFGSLMDSKMYL